MNNHPLSSLISNQDLLEEIAEEYGKTLYVYSENRLKDNINRLSNAIGNSFSSHRIYYAVKANSNIHIISVLKKALDSLGCDCSSPGELYAAQKTGVDISNCVYTGNYESVDDLKTAYKSGCEINLDDLNSLKRLENVGVPEYLSFRLNPGKGHGQFKGIITGGKDSKFGIPKEKITNAYSLAKDMGVKRFGLQCHAGSATLDVETFSDITKLVLNSAKEIETCINQKLEKISIGSGFGIPYKDDEAPLDLDLLFRKIQNVFSDHYGKNNSDWPMLCIEPGRILVADTGFILARVTGLKSSYKNFIGLDAGMETLMRPALYGAFHRVLKIGKAHQNTAVYDITGRICENTDRISENHTMPELQEGDLCAIMDAGAYGYSMSHNFNTRPRPAEIIINNDQTRLIRKRESIEDLFKSCDV